MKVLFATTNPAKIKKYAEAVQEKYNERNTGHDEHDKNNPKR